MPPQRQTQPQAPGKMLDLFFCVNGLDVATPLSQQVPDTTPLGINVRTFDPATNRARGASRNGLSKYIDQALPLSYTSGSRVIQNLTLVIDPTATAIGLSYPPNGGSSPPLNLSVNFVWFAHGSGFPPAAPPNLLIITAKDQTKTQGNAFSFNVSDITAPALQAGDTITSIDFQSLGQPASAPPGKYSINVSNVQISYGGGHTGPPYYPLYVPGTMTVAPLSIQYVQCTSGSTFPSSVTIGHLLVAMVVETSLITTGNPPSNVTDTLGNNYQMAVNLDCTYPAGSTGVTPFSVSLWYCISSASGSCTISAGSNYTVAGEEFKNTATTGVLQQATPTNGNAGSSQGSTNWSAGPVACSSNGSLVIVVSPLITPGSTGQLNTPFPLVSGSIDGFGVAFLSNTTASISGTITATNFVFSPIGINWFSYLVSFKPAF